MQTDPSKSGFVGDTVELRCVFVNGKPPVKISQVTWQKLINGTKQNVATANPALGVSVLPPFKERVSFKHPAVRQRTPSSLEDTTIVFSNLRLSDEAAYICEYTTFPAGNRENMVNLTVFGKTPRYIYSAVLLWIECIHKHQWCINGLNSWNMSRMNLCHSWNNSVILTLSY